MVQLLPNRESNFDVYIFYAIDIYRKFGKMCNKFEYRTRLILEQYITSLKIFFGHINQSVERRAKLN